MKKNKNMYYWLGGVAVFLVVAMAVFSQGELFSGKVARNPIAKLSPTACTYTYGPWSPATCTTGTQTRTYTASPSGCTGTPVTQQYCLIPAVQCPNQVAVNLSAVSGFGGDVVGGNIVSLGKWNFSSSTAVMLKNLTFIADKPAVLANLKLYDGATQLGSVSGYYGDPTGTIKIMDLNQMIPAGTTITIEAKGLTNTPNQYAPVAGDTLKLKLSSVDQLVDITGNAVDCGVTNNAANTWGPTFTLQAEPTTAPGTPVVISNVPAGAPAYYPDANVAVHKFSVSANGGTIGFNGNGVSGLATPSGIAPAQTSANQIVLKLVSSIAIPAGASCRLVNVTANEVLATTNTVADAAAPFENYLPFTFNQKILNIPAGPANKVDLEARCDMTSVLNAGIIGSTATFLLPSMSDVIQWSTAGNPDVIGSGASIVPVDLLGYTTQK